MTRLTNDPHRNFIHGIVSRAEENHRRAAIEYAKAQRLKHQMWWLGVLGAGGFLVGLVL